MNVIVIESGYEGVVGSLPGGTTDDGVRTVTVPVISHQMAADELADASPSSPSSMTDPTDQPSTSRVSRK